MFTGDDSKTLVLCRVLEATENSEHISGTIFLGGETP